MILGTGDWPQEQLAEAVLAGALSCRFELHAVGGVGGRYHAQFGRPISADAAYGFDAVALAIGIVRAHGADRLTAVTLQSLPKRVHQGLNTVAGFGEMGVLHLYFLMSSLHCAFEDSYPTAHRV